MNTGIKSIILIFLLVISGVSFSQWYPQSSGTNYALKSVYFTDANTGYTCGYNTVLKTTNAGINWINNYVQGNHQSITFVNNNTGYLCGDSGRIFISTNSGNNWVSQSSGTIKNLTSINFYNTSTGIATGYGKTLLKTTNSGGNWFSIANLIWEVDFLSSKIINAESYYVSGTDSYIIRTTNGGANWISYTHGEVNPLFTVEFINENTGFATGCCGMFMVTTNSGVNWSENFYLSLGFTFHSLKFSDQTTGFCAGDNGMIYRSTNGGLQWDSTVTSTDQTLYSNFMVNNLTGWTVGGFGTILKTTNGGGQGYTIGINQISETIPEKFSLHQNYPNPFNPITKINFHIPLSRSLSPPGGRVTGFAGRGVLLEVFDVDGRLIKTLFEGSLQPGTYSIDFNGSSLPSGVYFYILISGEYRETRKMVLIK